MKRFACIAAVLAIVGTALRRHYKVVLHEDDTTTVTFGDGVPRKPPPVGMAVRARYRRVQGKSSISRDSFDGRKDYSAVYQQQGRMLTDADWNEMVRIPNQRIGQTGLWGIYERLRDIFNPVREHVIRASVVSVEETETGIILRADTGAEGPETIDIRGREAEVCLFHGPVEVSGVGETFGGTYYVDEVTHSLREGSYSQKFKLTRNALGTATEPQEAEDGRDDVRRDDQEDETIDNP